MEDIALLLMHRMDTCVYTLEGAFVTAIEYDCSDLAWSLLDRLAILVPIPQCRFILSEGLRVPCRQGTVDIVNRLLDKGGDVNESSTNDGSSHQPSLLSQAAWTGQEETLRLLLQRGADVDLRGYAIRGILAAAWGGHINIAQILLSTRPELPEAGINAHLLLTRAMCSMKPEAVDFLRVFQERGLIDIHNPDKDPNKAEEALVELVTFAAAMGHVDFLKAFRDDFGTGNIR